MCKHSSQLMWKDMLWNNYWWVGENLCWKWNDYLNVPEERNCKNKRHGCITWRDFSSSMEKKMFLFAFIPFIETLSTDPFILVTTSPVHIHCTFTNFPFLSSCHPFIFLSSLLFIPLFSFLILLFLFNHFISFYQSTSSSIPHFA